MQTGQDRIAADATHRKHRPSGTAALPALFAAAVLLPLLGHRPLTDWDEGIYAEIAREMLAAHHWQAFLIPHWNGHLWFEKPSLQMWLTAASLRLFGLNAFAARLPSALAGVAIVALLHAWLQRRVTTLTASLSTVILLSAFGFQHAARVGETDTLLALFCLVAVLGLADLLSNRARGWLLFFPGFALALMTKGAASLTLPITALALTVLHPGQLLRYARTFSAGLLLFLALTLPWHVYLYAHFGQTFLHDYLGFHTLTRATNAIEGHHTHPWFYVRVLLISAPPFALLYPLALAAPFRRSARNSQPRLKPQPPNSQTSTKPSPDQDSSAPNPKLNATLPSPELQAANPHQPNPLRALAAFAFVTFLLFSAAGTRLPHYIAPAYPALSALTAALVAGWLQARPTLTRATALGLAAGALILYIGASLLTTAPRKSLHNPQLRAGYITPDNRESVALLRQLQHTSTPLPAGPLLVWRQNPVVPVTTDAFYAHRLAQQVTLAPPPAELPLDPYFNQPKPLTNFLSTPHLLLLDRSLIPQLPPQTALLPLATGPTQQLALLTPNPTKPPDTDHRPPTTDH